MKIREVLNRLDEVDGTTALTVGPASSDLQQAKDASGNVVATGTQDAMAKVQDAVAAGATLGDTTDKPMEEEQEDHPGHKHYDDWMNSEYHPLSHEHGNDNAVMQRAREFLHGRVHPKHVEYHAHHMTNKFHGMNGEMDENHKDLIDQGNTDVGGDATDSYIDQVRDKGFERAHRGQDTNNHSTISEKKKLPESDELMKWLTIAGIK